MAKLKVPISENPYLVPDELGAGRYCIGIASFRKLASEAGAVVKIGSRRLNNLKLLDEYVDSISGKNPEADKAADEPEDRSDQVAAASGDDVSDDGE